MTEEELKAVQSEERKRCLNEILDSKASLKLIVAGPGTGKTYTFRQLLAKRGGDDNLALTFINKLVGDMKPVLEDHAEVKTFHAYCKKVLHRQNGTINIAPYLPEIIQVDAQLLDNGFSGFISKIQNLSEASPELAFYLERGDYYAAVGFDDAVYRLLKQVQNNPDILPNIGQLVVDEFQDFNRLEVAFIEELLERADVLIVGDDDQAVYSSLREASPNFLREFHGSGKFEVFTLPYCSRCTKVVVDAANSIIRMAESLDALNGRISKPYECYLEGKEEDNQRYPMLLHARCTNKTVVPKYIKKEIEEICSGDIEESRLENDEYPTVLIVGPKHYLEEVEKQLRPFFPQLEYAPSKGGGVGLLEAYECLRRDRESNLGWRILLEICCEHSLLKEAVVASENAEKMINHLDADFVAKHQRVLQILDKVAEGDALTDLENEELVEMLGAEDSSKLVEHFLPKEKVEIELLDKSKPTIKLTSFVGCKGLSAGHVFIVGANAGTMPKDKENIQDIEISQILVALTRTRKCCHILSNKWWSAPYGKNGYIQPFPPSAFVGWLSGNGLVEFRGEKKAGDFK